MTHHSSTFDYLKPTEEQLTAMTAMREEFRHFAERVEHLVPDGPDKTYVIRHLRECAMWAMVAITRQPDGSPRS